MTLSLVRGVDAVQLLRHWNIQVPPKFPAECRCPLCHRKTMRVYLDPITRYWFSCSAPDCQFHGDAIQLFYRAHNDELKTFSDAVSMMESKGLIDGSSQGQGFIALRDYEATWESYADKDLACWYPWMDTVRRLHPTARVALDSVGAWGSPLPDLKAKLGHCVGAASKLSLIRRFDGRNLGGIKNAKMIFPLIRLEDVPGRMCGVAAVYPIEKLLKRVSYGEPIPVETIPLPMRTLLGEKEKATNFGFGFLELSEWSNRLVLSDDSAFALYHNVFRGLYDCPALLWQEQTTGWEAIEDKEIVFVVRGFDPLAVKNAISLPRATIMDISDFPLLDGHVFSKKIDCLFQESQNPFRLLKTKLLSLEGRPDEAQRLLSNIPLTEAHKLEILDMCRDRQRQVVKKMMENTLRTVEITVDSKKILSDSEGWHYKGTCINDAPFVIEEIVMNGQAKTALGHVMFRGEKIPFIEPLENLERFAKDTLWRLVSDRSASIPLIEKRWANKLVDISMRLSPPKLVKKETSLGWDRELMQLRLPRVTLKGGEIIPKENGPQNQAGGALLPGEAKKPEAITDDLVALWSILVGVAANVFRSHHRFGPLGILCCSKPQELLETMAYFVKEVIRLVPVDGSMFRTLGSAELVTREDSIVFPAFVDARYVENEKAFKDWFYFTPQHCALLVGLPSVSKLSYLAGDWLILQLSRSSGSLPEKSETSALFLTYLAFLQREDIRIQSRGDIYEFFLGALERWMGNSELANRIRKTVVSSPESGSSQAARLLLLVLRLLESGDIRMSREGFEGNSETVMKDNGDIVIRQEELKKTLKVSLRAPVASIDWRGFEISLGQASFLSDTMYEDRAAWVIKKDVWDFYHSLVMKP